MPLIDLSHTIADGTVTYPCLPAVRVGDYLTRRASRDNYAPGTEFHIGTLEIVGNSGTYLDTPFHRYLGGFDLAALPLAKVADVPAIVVDAPGPAIEPSVFHDKNVADRAVLRTGWARRWATPAYGDPDHPHLTAAAAETLVENGAIIVGIDSVNIDATTGGERPAHSALLGAGIPIVEHLTNLGSLLNSPFTFSAVPIKVAGLGTMPVRAFARW